jgi:hypothetical protein
MMIWIKASISLGFVDDMAALCQDSERTVL